MLEFKLWLNSQIRESQKYEHEVILPNNIKIVFDYKLPNNFQKLTKQKFSPELAARLTGSLPNSVVYLTYMYNSIMMQVHGNGIKACSTLYNNRINNDDIYINTNNRGNKTFSKMLKIQSQAAHEIGITRITAFGQQGGDNNGYYTLPRAGFDGDTEHGKLSDIMKTQQGRDFWKQHGKATHLTFDTHPKGLSRSTLDNYVN